MRWVTYWCHKRVWPFSQESLTQSRHVDGTWHDTNLPFKRREPQIQNDVVWLGNPQNPEQATRSAWENFQKAQRTEEWLNTPGPSPYWPQSWTSPPLSQRGKNATEIQVLGRISLQGEILTQYCLCSHPGHPGEKSQTAVKWVRWWRELWKAIPEDQIWWAQIRQAPASTSRASPVGSGIVFFPRVHCEFSRLSFFQHAQNLVMYDPKTCR